MHLNTFHTECWVAGKGCLFLHHVICSSHRVESVQNKSKGTASSCSHDRVFPEQVASSSRGVLPEVKVLALFFFCQRDLNKAALMLNGALSLYS